VQLTLVCNVRQPIPPPLSGERPWLPLRRLGLPELAAGGRERKGTPRRDAADTTKAKACALSAALVLVAARSGVGAYTPLSLCTGVAALQMRTSGAARRTAERRRRSFAASPTPNGLVKKQSRTARSPPAGDSTTFLTVRSFHSTHKQIAVPPCGQH
jgi:hypothetical protein